MNRIILYCGGALLVSLIGCQSDSPVTGPTIGADVPVSPEAVSAREGTPISGFVYNCEVLDPGVTTVTPDGVIQIRGFVGRSLLEVGNPLLDGKVIGSDINITIDPNKGTIKVRGKLTFYPDAFPDGTWRARTAFDEGPNKSSVNPWRGGHGTGSLQGRTFKLEARPLAEPRPNPCNPEDPSAGAVSGFVF